MSSISVFHPQQALVNAGRTIGVGYLDRTVFKLSYIYRAVVGYLGMRIFALADLFLLQLAGIPTGGPLSSYILEIVLGRCEYDYVKRHPVGGRGLDRDDTPMTSSCFPGLFARAA